MNPTPNPTPSPAPQEPEWHNPDNLESAGEGWRFLVKGEQETVDDEWWSSVSLLWEPCDDTGYIPHGGKPTYRTKRPLPVGEGKEREGEEVSPELLELAEASLAEARKRVSTARAPTPAENAAAEEVRAWLLERANSRGYETQEFIEDIPLNDLAVILTRHQREGEEGLVHRLAECFKHSGADDDGNEDWRLAPRAVDAVRKLRKDYDEACKENAHLLASRDAALAERDEERKRCHQMIEGKVRDDALHSKVIAEISERQAKELSDLRTQLSAALAEVEGLRKEAMCRMKEHGALRMEICRLTNQDYVTDETAIAGVHALRADVERLRGGS